MLSRKAESQLIKEKKLQTAHKKLQEEAKTLKSDNKKLKEENNKMKDELEKIKILEDTIFSLKKKSKTTKRYADSTSGSENSPKKKRKVFPVVEQAPQPQIQVGSHPTANQNMPPHNFGQYSMMNPYSFQFPQQFNKSFFEKLKKKK